MMTYEQVQEGQRVRLVPIVGGRVTTGTVKAKAIENIAGQDKKVIYVDTDRGGRTRTTPAILELID